MSDNRHFDMTGIGHELALQVAFGEHRKATHWFELPIIPVPGEVRDSRGHHAFDMKAYREKYGQTESQERRPWTIPPRLVFCWTEPSNKTWTPDYHVYTGNRPDLKGRSFNLTINRFPGKGIGPEAAWPIIEAWLSEAEYGSQPDHDGDNGKGYRIYNEAWGHVAGMWQAFVAIEPVWLMYGK